MGLMIRPHSFRSDHDPDESCRRCGPTLCPVLALTLQCTPWYVRTMAIASVTYLRVDLMIRLIHRLPYLVRFPRYFRTGPSIRMLTRVGRALLARFSRRRMIGANRGAGLGMTCRCYKRRTLARHDRRLIPTPNLTHPSLRHRGGGGAPRRCTPVALSEVPRARKCSRTCWVAVVAPGSLVVLQRVPEVSLMTVMAMTDMKTGTPNEWRHRNPSARNGALGGWGGQRGGQAG